MTKKTILYIITKSNWGGAQRYVYDLATSFDKNEFNVEVLVGGNGILKEKLEEAGISVRSLNTLKRDISLKEEFSSARELYKIYRQIKPDIVHLNSSKAGGLGAFIARLAGVPHIIFTAHAWAFNEERGSISKLIIAFLHWLTVILSHATIAVSESVKEQVVHMLFMKTKIKVVHLGIKPFEMLEKEDARIALSLNALYKNEIWIGAVSELHQVKGIPYAIDAIIYLKEKYPKIQFYIIGEGDQRELIEKQIQKRKMEDNVHLVGFKENAKSYLKAFDIFIQPSLSEAFGYSIAEAGLAKLPVVASNVGGIPEVIDDAGILIKPRNGKVLADAIEELLKTDEERIVLGERLFKRITTNFGIEKMLEETKKIYENPKQ